MKISTKARYGTRALLDLALHRQEEPVQLKDIARRQALSLSYLEHLFIPLIAAGIVKSTRGAKGGVSLAKPPSEIKLAEIIEALEGPVFLVDCLRDTKSCPRSGQCAAQDFWGELTAALDNVLESKTLEELAEQQKEKEKGIALIYQI
jgi:Rrf2 family cysteine metabolism transcriptional repressor